MSRRRTKKFAGIFGGDATGWLLVLGAAGFVAWQIWNELSRPSLIGGKRIYDDGRVTYD